MLVVLLVSNRVISAPLPQNNLFHLLTLSTWINVYADPPPEVLLKEMDEYWNGKVNVCAKLGSVTMGGICYMYYHGRLSPFDLIEDFVMNRTSTRPIQKIVTECCTQPCSRGYLIHYCNPDPNTYLLEPITPNSGHKRVPVFVWVSKKDEDEFE